MTLKLFGLERNLDDAARDYVYSMLEPTDRIKHVLTNSLAGTGKTQLAVASAVVQKLAGKFTGGIHYVVFPSNRGEQLGSVPGPLEEKEAKYFRPFQQAMHKIGYSESSYAMLGIEMTTASNWRGTNLEDAFIIIDEAQNASIGDLQLAYTRGYDSCKFVTTGCSMQCDNEHLPRYGKDQLLPFEVYFLHQLKQPYSVEHKLIKNHRGIQATHSDMIRQTINELTKGVEEVVPCLSEVS